MTAFSYFELHAFLDTGISLLAAFLLGGAIGLERQFRQRTAGLRQCAGGGGGGSVR